MYCINKINSNNTVDFAAEELKKYLRMMMPYCGEIDIKYDPEAKYGFKLGLMQDFGLDTSDADDVYLDDIVYIDTDTEGGIIAGSNPRSVLLAVYRYLRENGCRWLFPGIDGEYIPIKNIESVNYRKMADCRYRGQCNEGAEAQHLMMEAIDFTPKIGMNIFMLEFDNPKVYYDVYYNHTSNPSREPEPVSSDTVLQWKRQCEAEIAKRGLQFHDMGHGWTAEPFGINTEGAWLPDVVATIPENMRQYVAQINGERDIFKGIALNTNFCMSNPDARKRVAEYIADYSMRATNVDYMHVWLADGRDNHCECEKCQEKIPSDWYVMLMNEIDEELSARNLKTRIVFICYVDTTWSPESVELKNPDRFSLLLAAITRDYTECVKNCNEMEEVELKEYKRNATVLPTSVNEYIAHGKKWRKKCNVRSFVYEYHYWLAQYKDIALLDSARLIYDDIKGYKSNGFDGIVEDGSQRSYFPNGFSFFVYASTLFDTSVDFEELKEDYFSHAYGDGYRDVIGFFERLGKAFSFRYLNKKMYSDASKGLWYNPELVKDFEKARDIIIDFKAYVKAHFNMPFRATTVAYRILFDYLEFAYAVVEASILKAEGKNEDAHILFDSFCKEFGKKEIYIERWYDQYMMHLSLSPIFN